nr:MAG TPA: hypothetical protein [Caudoviricetes sp.]
MENRDAHGANVGNMKPARRTARPRTPESGKRVRTIRRISRGAERRSKMP